MTLSELAAKGLIREHTTNATELKNFRELIDRDMSDASIAQVSIDRRYATAYSAALNLSRVAIAVAGYRIPAKAGHHATSLQTAKLILGDDCNELLDYFDFCRRKRNKVDYDLANVASETELGELLDQVRIFKIKVETFIRRKGFYY